MSKLKDLAGEQFGSWLVLERQGTSASWWCRCRCGDEQLVRGDALREGRTRSCGCVQRDTVSKKSPTYRAWQELMESEDHTYDARWDEFETFVTDMGPAPPYGILTCTTSPQYPAPPFAQHFGPGNVEWMPMAARSRNQRRLLLAYLGRCTVERKRRALAAN